MVVGILLSGVLAALLSVSAAIMLEVGIAVMAIGYVLGGMFGGLMFLQVAFARNEISVGQRKHLYPRRF